MPHFPKPFFKPSRRTWYVEIGRRQHALGNHPKGQPLPGRGRDGQWNPPPEVWKTYYQIMADLPQETGPEHGPPLSNGHPYVAAIIDSFMGWLRGRVKDGSKAQRTLAWYEGYLASFLRFLRSLEFPPPEVPTLTINRLEPSHIYRWVDTEPGWKTGKRGAMSAVQRAFNWAGRAGLLVSIGGRSPLAGLEKPPPGRRDTLVSPKEYREALAMVRDQNFRDLLELSWETGCRPHELLTVQAAYVDLSTGRWVFPIRESKGKKIQRVVFLNDRALDISRRLVRERPSGPLLVNVDGVPWCASSVKCRFQQLCRRIGKRRLKERGLLPAKIKRLTVSQRLDHQLRHDHAQAVLNRRKQIEDVARAHGTRLNLYAFRHSMITESLVNGLDAVTVSVLAGHRDTTMISRHYAHLAQKHEHMRHAANRARGPSAST
jgi:integrase